MMRFLLGAVGVAAAALVALSVNPALAGGPIDFNTISCAKDTIRAKIAKDYERSGMSDAFTIAISANGEKYFYNWNSSLRPEDRTHELLQICEHVTKSQCYLAVESGKLTGATAPHESVISYPTEFTVSAVPFISEASRDKLNRYRYQQPHRAIAMRGDGAWAYVSQKDSEEEARAVALKNCSNGGRKCFLYSVDDQILFNKDTDVFPK